MTRHYRHNLHGAHGHWLARTLLVMVLTELFYYLRRRAAARSYGHAMPQAPPRVPHYFNRPNRIHLWARVRGKLRQL